jgi:hypothetical protein
MVALEARPQTGQLSPMDDERSSGRGIPIIADFRVTLRTLTQSCMVAKPAFQGLESRIMQLTATFF